MTRKPVPPERSPEELVTLKIWASENAQDHDLALRSRIVMMALEGGDTLEISTRLLAAPAMVKRWTGAFATSGTEGLLEALPEGRVIAARELAAISPGMLGKKALPGGLPGLSPRLPPYGAGSASSGEGPSETAVGTGNVKSGPAPVREPGGTVTDGTSETLSCAPAAGSPVQIISPDVIQAVERLVSGPPPEFSRHWSASRAAQVLGIPPRAAELAFKAIGIPSVRFPVLGPKLASRSQEDLDELERMEAGHAPTPEIARRAAAVAACLRGETSNEVASRFGMTRDSVNHWLRSFSAIGPAGLLRTALAEPPSVMRARPMVRALVSGPPPSGRNRWTLRLIADELGLRPGTVKAAIKAEGIRLRPSSSCQILTGPSDEEPSERERMAAGGSPTLEILSRAGTDAAGITCEPGAAGGHRLGITANQAGAQARPSAPLRPADLSRTAEDVEAAVLNARPLVRHLALGPPPEGQARWTAELIAATLGLSLLTVGLALDAEKIRLFQPTPAEKIMSARSADDLAVLKRLAEGGAPSREIAARAGALDALVAGATTASVGRSFGVSQPTVSRWASSFARLGPDWLVRPTPSDPRGTTVPDARQPVRDLVSGPPPEGHDCWTKPLIAEKLGLGVWSVKRALAAEGICLTQEGVVAKILACRTREDMAALERMAHGDAPSTTIAVRAAAVIAIIDGESASAVGRLFGFKSQTVRAWARSFARLGPAGL
ncbi:MAG: helix-turn-helix domain-containing protein [Deltaproteobacteria bacterium]|jgi:transposase|nr:helix-turn-helix domain-containing protein [Deltaproteobacteria bacterium]